MRAASHDDSLSVSPTAHHERLALAAGARQIAGVDEAGRGPLAGPVVVAAVVLADLDNVPDGIDDSKRVKAADRERIADHLMATCDVAIAVASRERIDRMNILRASLWAMTRAVACLSDVPDHVLVDGRDIPEGLPCAAEALIGGDGRSLSIAAASLVAKVTRDRLMVRAGLCYPAYGFEAHKGYSTRRHVDALTAHGPCPLHRQSFAPVRAQQLAFDV